jgi:predicted TIM-barrel fold metal-dependent hydrolase
MTCSQLAQLPVPVVLDHFGRGSPAQGPSQPDFVALLELVKSGRAYVKISGAWGTDWPHPNSDYGRGKPLTEVSPPFPIDDGLLLNQLPKWVPDAAVRKKILVDNPARLYGFEAAAG